MFNLVGKVASVIFLIAVVAAGVVLGVSVLGSGEDGGRVDTFRYILADRAASEAAEAVRKSTKADRICILPVEGDIGREVTRILEDRVRDLGLFDLVKSGIIDDALEEIREEGDETPLGIDDFRAIGKKVGAEAVVLARLDSFLGLKPDQPAEIDLALDVVDVETGDVKKEQFRDRIDRGISFTYFSASMNETSGWMRLIVWVLLVTLTPFATYFVVQSVTRKERNLDNFLMLTGYTFFDLFLALFLLGFLVRGFWMGLLVFIGLLAGAAYNYIACTIIYEMGK